MYPTEVKDPETKTKFLISFKSPAHFLLYLNLLLSLFIQK